MKKRIVCFISCPFQESIESIPIYMRTTLLTHSFSILCRGKEATHILDIDVSFISTIALFTKYVSFMICKLSLPGNLP